MTFVLKRRDMVITLVAFAVVALYVLSGGGNFPLDDSWIHHTFARNLAQYGEWSFVPGQPTAASTSPLYTVLLSLGYRLGIEPRLYTHVWGAVALAALGLVGARLSLQIRPDRPLFALGIGLFLVTAWHNIWAASAGMETAIFNFLTLWLIYLTWRERNASYEARHRILRAIVFGASVALATLTRPEGILLAGLCGSLLLMVHPQGLRQTVVFGIMAIVACGIVMTPYLLLNVQLTGGLLPDTASAKMAKWGFLLAIVPFHERLIRLLITILVGAQFLLIPTMLYYAWDVIRNRLARGVGLLLLLPLLWGISLPILYASRLFDPSQHGRYMMPALPALMFCGVFGLFTALEALRSVMIGRVLTRVILASAILTTIPFLFVLGRNAYVDDVTVINEEIVANALWIRDNLPKDALLALHDIGAVGYFSNRPDLLDVAGLISPEVIQYVKQPDEMWRIMQERGAVYFMGLPDQIPNANPLDPRLCQIFISNGKAAFRIAGVNMATYRIAWDEKC